MGKTINARAKGHSYELSVAKLFREELGYSSCVSSRSESKRLDALKVDLCYTAPFFIQCKAVEKLGCVHDILSSMPKTKSNSEKHLKGYKYNVVFHKKNRKGSIVCMSMDDFIDIVKSMVNHGIINPE